MSFSSHSANKTQNIYVLGNEFVPGTNRPTIYAEDIYKHKFTEHSKNLFLVYTMMVIILIYLFMEVKKLDLNHQLNIKTEICYV